MAKKCISQVLLIDSPQKEVPCIWQILSMSYFVQVLDPLTCWRGEMEERWRRDSLLQVSSQG